MTDGFDRWAESETPASFNSLEKNPTELTKGTMASGMRYGQNLDGMVGSSRKRKGKHTMPDGSVMLGSKHGGGIYDDFLAGFNKISNEFTNPQSYLQQGVGQVTNEFTNPDSVLRGDYLPKVGNEFTNNESLLRAQYLGQAADGVAKAAPILDMLGEQMGLGKGVGKTMAEILKGANEVNKAAKAVGYGKRGGRKCCMGGKKGALDYVSEYVPESRDAISQAKGYAPLLKMLLKGQAPQYSSYIDQGADMLGLGRRVGGLRMRNPAVDPRPMEVKSSRKPSARNEIVKRVMAERGVSMPQASSIVKREGLY